jgi:hypothetical protein
MTSVLPNAAPEATAGDERLASAEIPAWVDAAFPWVASATLHLGILLIVIFVAFFVIQKVSDQQDLPIIVPNSFDDPAYSEHPGGIPNPGLGTDPTRESAQDRLKEIARSQGWSQTESQDVNGLLGGQSGDMEAAGIYGGMGGSLGAAIGSGAGTGRVAPFGTPGGGGGIGPKSSFYGTGGNATRIVYVLDHSGSMVENFEFLKREAVRSVNALVPLQSFAVVMVSDKVTLVGPAQLQRAMPESKKAFSEAVLKELAQGQNDDLLDPFQQAFERAFAMKPQLIFFLTDGRFGEGLLKAVATLNREKKVHINTIAFVTEEPSYKGQLEQLARENGGMYKFIPERELGR